LRESGAIGGVTVVKGFDNFSQGIAQNMVQLEACLSSRKRKPSAMAAQGSSTNQCPSTVYGIITDALVWRFLECAMDNNCNVTYRLSEPVYIDYDSPLENKVTVLFSRIFRLLDYVVESNGSTKRRTNVLNCWYK